MSNKSLLDCLLAQNSRLPAAEYHAHPALSFSRLQTLGTAADPTPTLSARGKHIDEDSDALVMGTLVHLLHYEPERRCEIAVRPVTDSGRLVATSTREYGAWLLVNEGKLHVSPTMMADAEAVIEVLSTTPVARRWAAGTRTIVCEGSFFWTDRETGIECKIRPDRLCLDGAGRLVNEDLKTCRDPRPSEFRRDARFREYVRRMAWYRTGLRAITGEESLQALLVVGKEYRTAAVYMPSEIDLDIAEDENRRALLRYAGGEEWAEWERDITVL